MRAAREALVALIAFGLAAAGLIVSPAQAASALADPCAAPANPIVAENCLPGDADWLIRQYSFEIAGFASAASVNRGETLDLFVTTDTPTFGLRLYRTGYYGGAGARLLKTVRDIPGRVQPPCLEDAATGLTSCHNWARSYSLAIPEDWATGVYIAKLIRPDGAGENYIQFVVREDASDADLLYQQSVTTYQAYNNYGGKSLYGQSSNTCPTAVNANRAARVSFDRPYNAPLEDPHNYLYTEYPMVRWLEAQGYDVAYSTNLDTHRSGQPGADNALLGHRVFLISGHDEYWSPEMRAAITEARNAGVHLAVFSANTAYWKIRLAPSATGSPDRVMVSYKTAETSGSAVDPDGPTSTWRDPAGPNDPENALLGVYYIGDNDTLTFPLRVTAEQARDRLYRHTDLQTLPADTFVDIGQHLVGWEWDAVADNGRSPAGLEVLAASPVVGALLTDAGNKDLRVLGPADVHTTRYIAPSGAMVFAGGTIQWAWGLEWFEPNRYIQQITYNILAEMGAQPATPAPSLVLDDAASPSVVSSPTDRTAPRRLDDLRAPEITNIVSTVEGASVNISWETPDLSTGQVWLGASPDYLNVIGVTDSTLAQRHDDHLADLESNTRYYYRILAVGSDGATALSPIGEFQTASGAPVDELRRSATSALQPITCAVRPALRPTWQWIRLYPIPAAIVGGLLMIGVMSIVWKMRRAKPSV